jgi:ABC-type Na+ transport system ATPase subunit NatA
MLSMIDAQHLSKRYGERLAVDDLTFTRRARRCDIPSRLDPGGTA